MTFVTGSISHGQGRGDPNSYSDIISTWPTRGPRSSRLNRQACAQTRRRRHPIRGNLVLSATVLIAEGRVSPQ